MPHINKALLLLLVCFNVSADTIDDQFNDAYVTITATLEVVNTLGQQCDHQLNAYGAKGVQSKECATYMKSHGDGGILYNVIEPCAVVSKWYRTKQSLIQSNPNFSDTQPKEARTILKNMKWSHQVCPPKNPAGYEYIYKPMTKIKMLAAS